MVRGNALKVTVMFIVLLQYERNQIPVNSQTKTDYSHF